MEPGLDGPDGNPEFQRGFGVSEPLPVEGEHRRALARGQRGDRLPYPPGHLGGLGPLRRAGLRVGMFRRQGPG